MELDRNDGHFEEVLGRLDSLIRQGQPAVPPPPPPPVSEATIPVLTEVYETSPEPAQPDVPVLTEPVSKINVSETSAEEKLEQAVAAVLPMMAEALEEALLMKVQPAMERAFNQALEDLRPQIETILRQKLQTALTQDRESQTEM